VVIYLEQGVDLHMAKLMSLPLSVSCFSKIQIGFTFLVPVHAGSPGQRAIQRAWVCVLVKQKPAQLTHTGAINVWSDDAVRHHVQYMHVV